MFPGGVQGPSAGLSQQPGEAGGSLTPEMRGRAGSSRDNDGAGWHYQTARARLARWIGVTRVNQWLNPRKRGTGSNLVDMGRAVVRADHRWTWTATSHPVSDAGTEALGESLRRTQGEATGEKLGTAPTDRNTVNTGTAPRSPSPMPSQGVDGQAHRQPRTWAWGGAVVVVAGVTTRHGERESRSQGQGRQRVRSDRTGMPGAHG